MKRFFAALVFLGSFMSQGFAADIPLVEFKTPHGTTVTFLHSTNQDTVAISLAFACGLACDDAKGPATGLLAPSLLLEGADGQSSSELYEAFQDVGGSLSIDSTPDQTYASISAPAKGIEGAVKLVNIVLNKPDFPAKRFERKRDAAAERLEEASASPDFAVQKAFNDAAFEDHPYKENLSPTADGVRRVARSDLAPWVARHLVRNGIIVTLVGNVEQAQAGKLIDELLEGLPDKSDLPPVPPAHFKPAPATPIHVVGDKSDQAVVMVGSVFARDTALKDWLSGYMLGLIFSGDQKSRLFKDIREATAATYGMQPSTSFYEAISANSVSGRVAKNGVDATLAIVAKSWDKFRTTGPTPDEIANVKAGQLNTLQVLARNNISMAATLRDYLTGHWSTAELANLPSAIKSANLTDPTILKRYFPEKPIVVVTQ